MLLFICFPPLDQILLDINMLLFWKTTLCKGQHYVTLIHLLLMQFESAHKMLGALEKMNLKPTSSMYNAILTGYFREVTLFVYKDVFTSSFRFLNFLASIIRLKCFA